MDAKKCYARMSFCLLIPVSNKLSYVVIYIMRMLSFAGIEGT
jgi:hypothetical protein